MRASGTLLLVLLAATARGADAPADSIATAKKDLAAIKSPLSQGDPSSALPSLDMKDLGSVPGAGVPEPSLLITTEKDPLLDPSKKKTGTGNWLVDAMDKNTSTQGSRTREKDEILKGDPDLIKADEKGVRMEKDAFSMDLTREKEAPKERPESVYNPLDAFMSGWVSARDHDLLLTSKTDGLTGSDLGKVHADALPGLEPATQDPRDGLVISSVDTAAFGPSRGANPYVDSVEIFPVAAMKGFPLPDAPGLGDLGLDSAARGVSAAGPEPAPQDASRSAIPDFAQPTDDDKYFKQLKKF